VHVTFFISTVTLKTSDATAKRLNHHLWRVFE